MQGTIKNLEKQAGKLSAAGKQKFEQLKKKFNEVSHYVKGTSFASFL